MSEIMDKLKAARQAEFEIKAHLEHIESLHRIMNLPRSLEYAQKIAEKLARLERELNSMIDDAADRKEEAMALLKTLPAEEYLVLYQHYIMAKDWVTIADELYVCERSVYNLRRKAFARLENGKADEKKRKGKGAADAREVK